MPRNSFTKPVGTTRSKAVNRNGFFYNAKLGRRSEAKKNDDYTYFASELEFKTFNELKRADIDFLYQPSLPILSSNETFSEKVKSWDFKLIGEKTIIECKGQWINSKAHRDKKYLFLLECHLAINNGFRIILVSDLGHGSKRNPFSIGPLQAVHYKELTNVLHSP